MCHVDLSEVGQILSRKVAEKQHYLRRTWTFGLIFMELSSLSTNSEIYHLTQK